MRSAKHRRSLRFTPPDTLRALRNRAILDLFVSTAATVSDIAVMQVQDYRRVRGRAWIRLAAGGIGQLEQVNGKLEAYLNEYIAAARIADEPASPLFRYLRADKVSRLGMTPTRVSEIVKTRARLLSRPVADLARPKPISRTLPRR